MTAKDLELQRQDQQIEQTSREADQRRADDQCRIADLMTKRAQAEAEIEAEVEAAEFPRRKGPSDRPRPRRG